MSQVSWINFVSVVSSEHSGFLHHQSLKHFLLTRTLGIQREDLDEKKKAGRKNVKYE
jgi:hypothetical protein